MIKSLPPGLLKLKLTVSGPSIVRTPCLSQLVMSLPSSLSAFRLVTFVPELTLNGG